MRHPQFFLDFNAEVLFFVDYEQAEILEPDIFGNQSMSTDDNIDCPVFDFFDSFELFFFCMKRLSTVIETGKFANRLSNDSRC